MMHPMQRKCSIYTTYLMMLMLLVSCSGKNFDMKSPGDMSPKEIAVWADRVYTAEYDSYVTAAASPNLSEEQKVFLRKKKRLLTELYPLLISYNTYIETGVLPEQQITDKILDLVYKLTGGI